MFRCLGFFALMGAAIFGPIAYFSGESWLADLADSCWNDASPPSDDDPSSLELDNFLADNFDPIEDPNAEDPVPTQFELADVLRFDITPNWIVAQWPRVSTGLGHLPLHGYRVPLVTGTNDYDLAGALTYYFNAKQQVQRITFQGTTGSAQKVVDVVAQKFGLAQRITNTPGIFVFEIPSRRGRQASSLWIRPAPVLRGTDQYYRFEVAMLLERPDDT